MDFFSDLYKSYYYYDTGKQLTPDLEIIFIRASVTRYYTSLIVHYNDVKLVYSISTSLFFL